MQNSLFRKGLVIGIFVLFVGSSVLPNLSGKITENAMNISSTFLNEPPEEEWNKTYGGINSELGHSVRQTSDGGFIITGNTGSYSVSIFYDVWLIKTDADGNEQWNKTYGGMNDEAGNSVQQTIDGGYIITGITNSYGVGDYDIWLIKTDADGNEQWNKTFGSTFFDYGYTVVQTNDNGYMITATKYLATGQDDVWLIKTDADGNEQWNKTFGGPSKERAYSGQQTSDGGYIITGENGLDVWLIKTDINGSEQWNKTFSLSIDFDSGGSIQQTFDDGYIITGIAGEDVLLIKTDSYGNEQWSKTFGGNLSDYGRSVKQTSDGGYIITGETYSYGDLLTNVWLIKTDSNGNEQWNKTFGGADYDLGYSVQQTADEGYIITGYTGSYGSGMWDTWLIKVAPESSGDPDVIVEDISGGFRISADIKNNGTGTAYNVSCSIDLVGGLIFIGRNTEDIISELAAGDTTAVNQKSLFGLGRVDITVTAGESTKTASGFVLGPFVFGVT